MLKKSFLFLFAILLFGCRNTEDSDNRTIFNYNESNGVTSLDPAAATPVENIWPVNQLFNGLVQMDDSLNVIPCIAKNFKVSDNGLVYTFILRGDVYFHDNPCFENGKGRMVTARDFAFSFHRLFDSKVSGATTLLDRIDRSRNTNFKGFEAINDTIFSITLTEPFSAFPSVLTMKYFSVIPFEAIEMYKADFRKNPVGTGPFMFKLWDEGSKLVLVKNPNYFERDKNNQRLPYLDAVTVSFIRDRETAFMELLNDKFDMLSGADAFNTNEVLDKEGRLRDLYAKKFYLQKVTYLKTDYIGILVDDKIGIVQESPLRFKKVRQAINYAFDRDKLVKYIRNNIGIAAHSGFIPKGMKSYNEKEVPGYTYDPDKARELLAGAGFPDGKGLPEMTIHISDIYKEQAEFIQSQLAQNNIHIQLSIEKTSVLRQAVNSCEFMMYKKSWVADYADEENFMSLFYSKNFAPQGVNYSHFSNEKFDKAFEQVQKESNEVEKIKLYQEMERIIIEEAPVIPLFYDEVVRLVNHKVSGLNTNPMNLLNLKTVMKASRSE